MNNENEDSEWTYREIGKLEAELAKLYDENQRLRESLEKERLRSSRRRKAIKNANRGLEMQNRIIQLQAESNHQMRLRLRQLEGE
jgi:regulator of replication initiation timing